MPIPDIARSQEDCTLKKDLTHSAVLALKGYSVKKLGGKYYVSPSAWHGDKQGRWAGPYKTLNHACAAIGRKLAREFKERQERQVKFYERYQPREELNALPAPETAEAPNDPPF